MEQENLNTIALSLLPKLNPAIEKRLIEDAGSATELFNHRNNLKAILPDVNSKVQQAFADADDALRKAEKELEFITKNNIQVLYYTSPDYPERLRHCEDAPSVLFYIGNANLNRSKIISIVGTRKATQYGKDICNSFIADLKRYYSDILVVSGLAYGIDIYAHKASLTNNMDTVGVLAHGLDRIYPATHRDIAKKMIRQGGLLTEYISGTTPERINFIRRNRIVAGISDCTIVVESASHGGALITADIASSYHRDVFAFPGRVYDEYSEGCNNLIKNQKAVVIQNAEDLINAMIWDNPLLGEKEHQDNQLELFPELSPEQMNIVDILRQENDLQINQIIVRTNMNYSKVSAMLFELEMQGIINVLGGARYHLIQR